MKKKLFAAGIVIGVAALTICARLLICPKSLGNIRRFFAEAETGNSCVTFTVNSGDRLRLCFRSDIDGGELNVIIYNADGERVKDMGYAGETREIWLPEETGEYRLQSEYTAFIGDYEIVVYKLKR